MLSKRSYVCAVLCMLMLVAAVPMQVFGEKTSVFNPTSQLSAGYILQKTTQGDFSIEPGEEGSIRVESCNASGNGMNFTKKLSLYYGVRESGGSIHFTISSPMQFTAACMTTNSTVDRFLGIYRASNNQMLYSFRAPNASLLVSTLVLTDPGEYYIASTSGRVDICYISLEEVSEDKDTVNNGTSGMSIQYKKQEDGNYTVRLVYTIEAARMEECSSIGVRIVKSDNKSEDIIGKNVYSKLKANGVTLSSENGYFVIVELTDVPSQASFSVSAIGKKKISGEIEVLTDSAAVNMLDIVGTATN